MTRTLSLRALGRAMSMLDPQALDLSDRYFHANIAVGPEATDDSIARVVAELPRTLAVHVGGPAQQFSCTFHTEGSFRWVTLRRQLLPGTRRIEPGMHYIEELLDDKVFSLLEQLVVPQYQGAVYGRMEAYKAPNGMIVMKLVRRCGRWRIALSDLDIHLADLISHPCCEGEKLQFLIDGDATNERILDITQQVAAHLELYFPSYIYLEDTTERLPYQALTGKQGNYRFWMDLVTT